jgi:hypothetical protein
MSITRLIPGGDTITRLSPGGETIARSVPGGELIARSVPGGDLVTRTIPASAAGEEGDGFADYINDIDALAAWWSPNGKDAGDLEDDEVAMEQMGPIANPDMVCIVASTGNWRVIDDNIGNTPSLTSALESLTSDGSNFCGIDSAVSPATGLNSVINVSSGAKSGFAFFKSGAANWDASNYGNIFQFNGNSSLSGATYDDYNGLGFVKGTSSKGNIRFSTPQTYGLRGGNFMDVGKWYFIGWSMPTYNNVVMYLVEVGTDWDEGERTPEEGTTLVDNAKNGLTLGNGCYGGARFTDGWRWGPIGFFTNDVDEDVLQGIYEAIE